MKRIYASLALLAGVIGTASAQTIDLEAQMDMAEGTGICLGDTLQPDTLSSQPYGIWGVVNNGPETMVDGDDIMYLNPRSSLNTDGSVGPVWLAAVEDVIPAGEVAWVGSYVLIDSIKTLLDIDALESGTAETFEDILVPKASLVNGQTYGFYLYVIGIGDDPNSPANLDTVNNNWAYTSVVWNDCATSIEEMIVGKEKVSLTTYPNPAQNSLGFDYNFSKASNNSVAKVTDVTGRVVLTQDFGKAFPGNQSFKVDVSSLNAGMYIIEFSTDNERAVSKFNVSK